MRKIACYVNFADTACRNRIGGAAEKLGFTVDYYDSNEALAENIGDYEVIFGHPDAALLKDAKKLRWLGSDWAGVDKYLDDNLWPSADCMLTNGSGAYGPTISEHVVMVLLMLLRRMPEYQRDLSQRKWTYLAPIRSIVGSRVVMLGTGDIGANIARRLRFMGAEITGVCRSGKCEEPAFARVLPLSELDSVLPQADALIMALPGTPETVGVLSRERIELLPETAYVINVGRGPAIDQEALVEALNAHRIAGAALDVMMPEPLPVDHPLWDCPNLVLTPHVSGNMSLGLTCEIAVDIFLENLGRYVAGEPLRNLIDRKKGY